MKPTAAFAALCALGLGLEQARSKEPFKPVPVAPPCNSSVNRGAQEALDTHMAKAQIEVLEKKRELERERQRLSAEGKSTEGINTSKDVQEIFARYDLQTALNAKVSELASFALKKYKCEPALFYFLP